MQQWVISTGSYCKTFKISIFWWWRASGREEGWNGRWRRTKVHKNLRQRASGQRWEREGVRVWGRENEGERETEVMIDARLPPLCSREWLQQKAQNNIPDSLLCFFFLPLLSASQRRWELRSQLCRGYAETASKAGSLTAINKLGLDDRSRERNDLQLTVWAGVIAVDRKQKD